MIRKEPSMEPDPQYRPADHAASWCKAASAWLLYAVMLIVGLGLPSLWAEATDGSAKLILARASAAIVEIVNQL
jgi:hypothetical protein